MSVSISDLSSKGTERDRVEPACQHFRKCGGCSLQNWSLGAQLSWKQQFVSDSLTQNGIFTTINPIVATSSKTRRRAIFSVRRVGKTQQLGFNMVQSHEIISIEECHVIAPEITDALPMLRDLAQLMPVKKNGGHITVTLTKTGLDISLSGVSEISLQLRGHMSNFALNRDLARLSIEQDVIIEIKRPIIYFGEVVATPPPGGFLQACEKIEQAMALELTGHFKKSKHIADLFSGSGAFAFYNAKHVSVHAVEGDEAAVACIDRSRRGLQGYKAISIEKRDLFRRPLLAQDLKAYDGVIFDPPRSGAENQCKMLAKSKVKKIAAVSCNPLTLSRDLRILVEGGYSVLSVTPYDQFLWTPHVEVVALLERQ
jgi:23S rRNA (uracil1939-C5)-methyltransferase